MAEIQRVKNIEREAVKKELLAGKGEPTVEDQFDTDEEAEVAASEKDEKQQTGKSNEEMQMLIDACLDFQYNDNEQNK